MVFKVINLRFFTRLELLNVSFVKYMDENISFELCMVSYIFDLYFIRSHF